MINLYDYQERTVDKIRDAVRIYDKILVCSATGSGKTIISKYIIERLISNNKKVLFTVPRIKLAIQTKKSFGFGNLILGDKTENNNSLCTIASVQSLYTRKITEHFDFILIDECHFAHNSEYIKYIFDTYKDSKIIGLSATPLDQFGYLLQGYDALINEVTINQLIGQGYLTPVELYTSRNTIDTSKIDVIDGDYNQAQSSEVMRDQKVLSNSIEEWIRITEGKLKTIVFATDIKHCDDLHSEFERLGFKVGSVHSKKKESDISDTYDRFRDNEINILINVDLLTFGFDEPSIECMLFVRPIKSLRLYIQMVGRGIRTFSGKTKCIMIDCANVVLDNGYPTDDIVFIKKPVISKRIDSLVKIERDINGEIDNKTVPKERIEYLEKVGSLIDLYADKVYSKEQDLLDDCRTILKRGGYNSWRQNSGKANIEKRWVQFTDKAGLPDITLIYKSVYIGLELKLPKGLLTPAQKITLSEFVDNKIIFFIIESVIDLFEVLEIIIKNITQTDTSLVINNFIYILNESQQKYRRKYKLNDYEI
jgi:superfamily II DNA or RNA helicase